MTALICFTLFHILQVTMSKKNKKKRNTNNKAAAEERPVDGSLEVTQGVSQCSLGDRGPESPVTHPEPGPGAAWAVQSREGRDPHLVATRSIKPLEVVIEDTAIVTVPVVKVSSHQHNITFINSSCSRYLVLAVVGL